MWRHHVSLASCTLARLAQTCDAPKVVELGTLETLNVKRSEAVDLQLFGPLGHEQLLTCQTGFI